MTFYRISLVRTVLYGCLMLSQTFGVVSATDEENTTFWNSVYKENHVVQIHISANREAWDAMQPKRVERNPDGPKVHFGNKFGYAKVNITIDGELFKDAGLRFKGNSSYRFAGRSLKKPFKIDTNRFIKGQKIYGRTKINLSNAFLDSAFMKEKLGYEIYRAAGIPTPGVGWAAVTLTVEGITEKKHLGIYCLIEQMDDRYLIRKFGKDSKDSLLMKPEAVDDWEYFGDNELKEYQRYGIKYGEDKKEQIKRFAELLKLIEHGSKTAFQQQIGKRLDLDYFAGYLAATSILVNIDSYIGMPHNYYLMIDKANDKLRILPWDLNETFGTFTMGRSPEMLVKWDIDKPWISKRRLSERLFEMESFQKRYRTVIAKLMKEDFTEEKLFKRIDAFEKAITPHIKKDEIGKGLTGMHMGINGDSSGVNKAVDRRVFAIKPFIRQRITSVNDQLAGKAEGEKIQGRRKRPR
ncbi:MAG: CotH kinase family protein [Verrucomicrobiota bacterium]|nr:CotH kinase family protein [Verrucomicrobiota bacterium]